MPTHQKLPRNTVDLCHSRWLSARPEPPSGQHGHLRPMETEPLIKSLPDDADTLEPAFSLKELAVLFGVSVQALYDLRSQGRGPTGFRVGRQLRFRRSEVKAWLERMEAEDLDRHPHKASQ